MRGVLVSETDRLSGMATLMQDICEVPESHPNSHAARYPILIFSGDGEILRDSTRTPLLFLFGILI